MTLFSFTCRFCRNFISIECPCHKLYILNNHLLSCSLSFEYKFKIKKYILYILSRSFEKVWCEIATGIFFRAWFADRQRGGNVKVNKSHQWTHVETYKYFPTSGRVTSYVPRNRPINRRALKRAKICSPVLPKRVVRSRCHRISLRAHKRTDISRATRSWTLVSPCPACKHVRVNEHGCNCM